ncbi:MAG: DUF2800 domain-containing protein [Candidatus Paceibacterota bacterium]|jgi:hypothetical protein
MISLYPSHAHRWIKCSMSAHAPRDTAARNDAALEGIAAHKIAGSVLKNEASGAHDFVGRTIGGHFVTSDMAIFTQIYIDYIRSLNADYSVEMEVKLPHNINGRCDNAVITASNILHIVDFKFGWKIVEPQMHEAMMLYARGFLQPHHQSVKLTIVQPRPNHTLGKIRHADYSVDQIVYHTDYFFERAALAQQPNPIATPGRWCDGCNNAVTCAALGYNIYDIFEIVSHGGHLQHNLGESLKFLQLAHTLITAQLKSTEAEVEANLSRGVHVPGWMFEPKIGHRKWKFPLKIIEAMSGFNLTKTVELSPAQAEMLGLNTDGLTTTQQTGKSLVEATHQKMENYFK